MDLGKFISMLTNNSLFFCRLDKLEDQFEGTTSRRNFDLRVQYYKQLRDIPFYEEPPSDEEILKMVGQTYTLQEKLKHLTCINCWNKYDQESAALWKIYSDFGKGIMIKTCVENLINSLEVEEKEIHLSKVKYIDFENELMQDGATSYPIIHKHNSYSYEEEIRMFLEVKGDSNWTYDWKQEEVEEGKYCKVDLNKLIIEIIIGPFSQKWLFNSVVEILKRFNIKSKLSF